MCASDYLQKFDQDLFIFISVCFHDLQSTIWVSKPQIFKSLGFQLQLPSYISPK